jgi:germination protein M
MDKHRADTPEQIDRYWDRLVGGRQGRFDGAKPELADVIDTLHAADRSPGPSADFRAQLRADLMREAGAGSAPVRRGPWSPDQPGDIVDSGRGGLSRVTVEDDTRGTPTVTTRRWWMNHTLELAAMLAIIVIAAVAVAYFTGGGDTPTQPGVSPDQTPEVMSTPDVASLPGALTFEQAQETTPFDLIMPPVLPEGYELAGILVNAPPVGDVDRATFVIRHQEVPERRFELWQLNARITVSSPADASVQELDIDGLPVTRMVRADGQGDEMTIYVWHQDGLGMEVVALTGIAEGSAGREPEHAVDGSDLEGFVRGLIEARASDDMPAGPIVAEPTPTPAVETTPSPQPTPTPTEDAAVEMMPVTVYLVRDEKIGTARREAPHSVQVATTAINQLLQGPSEYERDVGLSSAVPAGTRLLGLTIQDGIATVDLSGEFASGGGSLSMQLRVAQVVYTLTQFSTVDAVEFRIDGRPVTALGGEGLMLDRLLGRIDFDDVTPLIFVESPAPGETVSSPLRVWGTANTYEATFMIEVFDSTGRMVYEDFVTATSGSGDRGTFEVSIEFDAQEGLGAVIVYQPSAADGSRMNEVEIPVWIED